MIQRIQSVYLLAVAILMVLLMSFPMGVFTDGNAISEFTNLSVIRNEVNNYAPWALFVILLIVAIQALGTIFLFRKRMLQIRFCMWGLILLMGYYVTFLVFIFLLKDENESFIPSWTICLPFVAIILEWLSIRAIGKDEMLVKAYERLR